MIDWLPQELTNVFSQFGEDSIINEIVNRLPAAQKDERICVEFGAWDGVYLSNTANLVKNHGWLGVFIESDPIKFRDLEKNYPNEKVKLVNTFVQFVGTETLDHILTSQNIPSDFDMLSIDIDGNDYWVFDSLKNFKPKIIIIEFNPTIPNTVSFINPKDSTIKQGSSLKALIELAEIKGYVPIATTLCNLFLVDVKYADIFQSETKKIDDLYTPTFVNYMWTGFDGTLFFEHDIKMLWHNYSVPAEKFQPLPKYLRVFPEDYSTMQKMLFKFHCFFRKIRNN